MSDETAQAARTAIEQCLNVTAGESVLVVTDDEREPIGEALYGAAIDATDDVSLIRYPPGDQHGEEPPASVAAAMSAVDVFLAPTTRSLSHTRARGSACDAGARGVTLPGITADVFVVGLDADYGAIADHSAATLAAVAGADEIRVTSPQGTDITFEVGDREWLSDTGMVHEPGAFSNLPAGEVFVAPESATGTYVVDGTMRPHGLLGPDQRLTFEVEEGLVTSVSDDAIRADLEAAAESVGDAAYNLAELGIGTNVGVDELVGSVLLDEKAAGTVHIAIGDNASIGGETDAPVHLDGILREPTVYADGEEIDLPSA